jgi:DNA-binding HxlR family transcriptional regulator
MKHKTQTCQFKLMASRDALEVIQGKWRIPIIISLTYGNKHFGEIYKDIENISTKMLSQELKALEMNKIVKRTVYDTIPNNRILTYSIGAINEKYVGRDFKLGSLF